ncbi:MAG: quinone oxidoreductase family protein [Pseudomonadota bacterium]
MKTGRIAFAQTGGPEVLAWRTMELGAPGPGEVLLRQEAIGLNFIDIYHRTGLYPLSLPSGLGLEAAGVIEAVGQGVTAFQEGERVAYGWGPVGAYATHRLMPADMLVPLPEGIDARTAAAVMLKGATAEYLIRRTYPVKAGETVLFHAVAGGVGLIACQWLKALGATVIGTVGGPEKAALAARHGCDHVIDYRREDFVARVREITKGRGVPVVFDGVGRATWEGSLDCLARRGLMVSYGNASGAVTGVDLALLAAKGSLYVTRPTLAHYYADARERAAGAKALFHLISSGAIKVAIGQTYPLQEAGRAQRDLEGRKTVGSTLLLP